MDRIQQIIIYILFSLKIIYSLLTFFKKRNKVFLILKKEIKNNYKKRKIFILHILQKRKKKEMEDSLESKEPLKNLFSQRLIKTSVHGHSRMCKIFQSLTTQLTQFHTDSHDANQK